MENLYNVIYCITNMQNNHKYIGSAIDYKDRKRCHIQHLHKNKHHSKHLQRAWNLYGETNFEFSILEQIENKIDLVNKEQFWINKLSPEYNMCKIAGSSLGIKRDTSTKEKCRLAHLGEVHPQERKDQKKKKVYQLDRKGNLVKEWKSATDAAIELNLNRNSISACARGLCPSYFNFIWKY